MRHFLSQANFCCIILLFLHLRESERRNYRVPCRPQLLPVCVDLFFVIWIALFSPRERWCKT
ncbi:uncharacterized protein [Physcomitrium patens]|uniref:uncharacterized protein isoform X2 n=1 Tax=Physcomitrium patens TaxID=3218 RepID=UPI003CCDF926